MSDADRPVLELSMANQDALVDLLGLTGADRIRLLPAARDGERERANQQQALSEMLEAQLADLDIVELPVAVLRGEDLRGRLVGVDQDFYFRQDETRDVATFQAKLNTDRSVIVTGEIDRKRYPFSSTRQHLSGHPTMYLIARVLEHEDTEIRVRPIFFGQRHRRPTSTARYIGPPWRERRVHPSQIDQFRGVNFAKAPTALEMAALAAKPERDVKAAFAQILGQPFVDDDWGGERSDLRFDRVLVDGVMTSSSWLFKGGKGVPGPMYIASLGKRGDQIERLTTDGSELLVVQHARAITAPVTNMLAAFAHDMRNPRRYMVLDGTATAIILRDKGSL